MEVIQRPLSSADSMPCVATLGAFDGVHRGHRHLIAQLVSEARKHTHWVSTVISFWPHPQHILKPSLNLKLLTTLSERIAHLSQLGVDRLVIMPFDETLARQSAVEFVEEVIMKQLGAEKLLLGYDHRFGHKKEGSYATLKQVSSAWDLILEEGTAYAWRGVAIQARRIRDFIREGKVKEAADHLGYAYQLQTLVEHGEKKGQRLGYPTANLRLQEPTKLIPKDGVYAVSVHYNHKTYDGMLYIGQKKTPRGYENTMEVNIFDFSDGLYGKILEISLHAYIRSAKQFSSDRDLQAALRADEVHARRVLKH